jgi:hypothetical protein
MEAVLLELCELLGSEEVRKRIASVAFLDQMVKICFSPGNTDPREALKSYYSALVAEVSPLVLWTPRVGGAT